MISFIKELHNDTSASISILLSVDKIDDASSTMVSSLMANRTDVPVPHEYSIETTNKYIMMNFVMIR